jgi:ubiquinone/menaquinone biosynthesis C-methylase UbiE
MRHGRILETAAGTGMVTRALVSSLPESVSIVATDLNQPMLDHASRQLPSTRVTWRQADAQHLPFLDGEFDAVVCQFGAMFFPDKPRAFSEAYRVLKPGGCFLFNVWDRIEENEFADIVVKSVAPCFLTIHRCFWPVPHMDTTTPRLWKLSSELCGLGL